MKTVIKIFEQLKNTSGKKDKEAIIETNKDNELFKECLVFLLDDNVTTGIAKKSLQKNIKCDGDIMLLVSWQDCMSYLKENNTGKDYDILVAQGFVKFQDEADRWFYEGMITKTLKIGCDKAIVNKVIPQLIPDWKVQLGSSFEKLRLKDNEKFFLSKKMNGHRGSFYEGKFISRQGKEISGLQHIIDDIEKLYLSTYFIDGELIRKNVENLDDNENFRITSSILNSDTEDKSDIEFVIFDIFPADTIVGNHTIENYSERKKRMKDLEYLFQHNNIRNLKIVEMVYEGTDPNQIHKWLKYAVDNDWEGIMLNKDVPYVFKRTTNVIKIKQFLSIDLRIIGYEEGQGKNEGKLGAFVVDYKGNKVEIGGGYSDEERATFWEHRDEMIGKIIEIKYKGESQNKRSGLKSLQFADFVCIRNDKNDPSYN